MKNNHLQKNIPSGWKLIPADQIFDFVKSYAFSRDNLVGDTDNSQGIGNIHYGDIHSKFFATSIDLGEVSVPMVKDDNFNPQKDDFLKDGDLIMADVSEDYEGIGVTVLVHGLGDKKIVGGLHTFVMRDNKNITDKYFRQYIFRNPKIRNSLQKIANGVSVYGVSKTSLSKLFIPVPPLSEQKRIVAVFGSWDRAIKKLENKIEIKKEINKGLMRDLLTGQKRLNAFKDEWIHTKLGDVCGEIKTGKLDANAMKKNGKYRFYTCAKEYYFIDDFAFDTEALLISGNGANLGYIHYYKGKFNAYQRTYILDKFREDIFFIKFLLDVFLHKRILDEKCEGNTPYIKMDTLSDMKIKIPRTKEEQSTIANILMDADKEISELEKKLSIIKNQKRYLLNNLITGKIRTPENLSINK